MRLSRCRVNGVMRGVLVGAGSHEVVWSYRVPGLRIGLLVSGIAFVVLLGGVVVAVRRRRVAAGTEDR